LSFSHWSHYKFFSVCYGFVEAAVRICGTGWRTQMDVPGYSHKKEMIYGGESGCSIIGGMPARKPVGASLATDASGAGRRGLDARRRGLEADTDAGKSNLAAVDPSRGQVRVQLAQVARITFVECRTAAVLDLRRPRLAEALGWERLAADPLGPKLASDL
jgi:hypothetical protein